MLETLNNRFVIKLIYLALITLLNLFCLVANAQNNEPKSLSLYLPINSNNMQAFTTELELVLQESDLSNISIRFADHWHDYQQGLRNGQMGIYFAPPHFAAWAINKHNFKPILRIAEPLSFVIASKRAQSEIFELNDLIGRSVCTQSPLNIDYLLSTQVFNSRVGSVNTQFIADVSTEIRAKQSNCVGFSVSNHVLLKLRSEGNNDDIRLYQGRTYNNYALIAHSQVAPDHIRVLREFFIQTKVQQILQPLLSLYANETKLISSNKNDYPITYIDILDGHWN